MSWGRRNTAQNDATLNRVYGGDTGLVHVADGKRAAMGLLMAQALDDEMRYQARELAASSGQGKDLCPGCYMVVLVNMAVELARQNGQSITELGNTMAQAFAELAANGDGNVSMEHIAVVVDPPEPEAAPAEPVVTLAEAELLYLAALHCPFPII